MSLPHALLTSILEKPSTGYELARRFDKSIAYFWHATHQQIYRELAKMELAGWISATDIAGARAGMRQYQVLAEGVSELQRWAASTSKAMPLRDELMLKLRADAAIGPLGLNGELQRLLELHSQQLANYLVIRERDFSAKTLSRAAALQLQILNGGIAFEQGRIAWLEQTLSLLEQDLAS